MELQIQNNLREGHQRRDQRRIASLHFGFAAQSCTKRVHSFAATLVRLALLAAHDAGLILLCLVLKMGECHLTQLP